LYKIEPKVITGTYYYAAKFVKYGL